MTCKIFWVRYAISHCLRSLHWWGISCTLQSAPNSTIPCIGASGGIAGVITFYALAFPQAKIGFLWRYFYYFRWIRLPAWFVFVLWIFFQIIGAYEQKIGISSVSSFAHLGGAGVGLVTWC